MKHTKQLLAAGLLTASVVGGGLFALSASAATSQNPDDGLAARIAAKFNINQNEVQALVDDFHQERWAEHEQERQNRLEERLTGAVEKGDLTEEQKTKILDYVKSQESFFDALKDKTQQERRDAIKAHRDEVKKWAEENDIDPKYVLFGGHGGPGHHGGPMMKGGHADDNQ